MEKYRVYMYKDQDDFQYGHKYEINSNRVYSTFGEAINIARSEFKRGRFYATMVYDENNILKYMIDYSDEKYFIKGNNTKDISKLCSNLIRGLTLPVRAGRVRLIEENGLVNLYSVDWDLEVREVLRKDIFKYCDNLAYETGCLIEKLNSTFKKPVKSVIINPSCLTDSAFYKVSEDEKGSIDLYFDYY